MVYGVSAIGFCVLASAAFGQAERLPPPMPDKQMTEPMPKGGPTEVSSGSFTGLAHKTSGKASVYETKDGKHLLRLEQLNTSNGPDLRVYLVKGTDATANDVVKAGDFVDLGALKGNIGSQNYEIPEKVNLDEYRSVSIWCRRFGVNFAAAPLAPPTGKTGEPGR
jgi:hypothetical protein